MTPLRIAKAIPIHPSDWQEISGKAYPKDIAGPIERYGKSARSWTKLRLEEIQIATGGGGKLLSLTEERTL
jgi:hypothetical protein